MQNPSDISLSFLQTAEVGLLCTMQDLGYIITISFGRCFGVVPPIPHQQYDCDAANFVSRGEAWFEGEKEGLCW